MKFSTQFAGTALMQLGCPISRQMFVGVVGIQEMRFPDFPIFVFLNAASDVLLHGFQNMSDIAYKSF